MYRGRRKKTHSFCRHFRKEGRGLTYCPQMLSIKFFLQYRKIWDKKSFSVVVDSKCSEEGGQRFKVRFPKTIFYDFPSCKAGRVHTAHSPVTIFEEGMLNKNTFVHTRAKLNISSTVHTASCGTFIDKFKRKNMKKEFLLNNSRTILYI